MRQFFVLRMAQESIQSGLLWLSGPVDQFSVVRRVWFRCTTSLGEFVISEILLVPVWIFLLYGILIPSLQLLLDLTTHLSTKNHQLLIYLLDITINRNFLKFVSTTGSTYARIWYLSIWPNNISSSSA